MLYIGRSILSDGMDLTFQRTIIILLALGGLMPACWAQNDTTLLLTPERLTEKDVVFKKTDDKFTPFTTATRNVENPANLPFTTWVITAEDILRYGFVTLADVLKAAPGMRVSQPGNAIEGETFMMRGQVGNQYVKVLINDVPIKSGVALGTTIGAQLPIRQAARIEVLYGPQGVMYGNEACAGVVNIILKETERPIFTQADLSFGSQGFNNLDLTFGGKIFSDKNIVRFSVFGSSTIRTSTDVYDGLRLYDLEDYRVAGLESEHLYDDNPNFREDFFGASFANFVPLTHESRLLGLSMSWRGFSASYFQMTRKEMGCLGFNPLARSYIEESNIINDRNSSFNLRYNKKWDRLEVTGIFMFNGSNMSANVSKLYIFDQYNTAYYYANGGTPTSLWTVKDSLAELSYSRLNGRQPLLESYNTDFRNEGHASYRLFKKLWLQGTYVSNFFIGDVYTNRFAYALGDKEPPAASDIRTGIQLYTGDYDNQFAGGDIQLAGQLDWRGSKLRVTAGTSVALAAAPAFRIAALYRFDSTFAVFANHSTGYKNYSPYEAGNTFEIYKGSTFTGQNFNIDQRFSHYEAGLRVGMTSRYSEVMVFHQTADNLIRNGNLSKTEQPGEDYDLWQVGYYQVPGWGQRIWGLQARAGLNITTDFEAKDEKNPRSLIWRSEYSFQITRGQERWQTPRLDGTTEERTHTQPFNTSRWMGQFRATVQSRKLQFTFTSHNQGSVSSKSLLYKDNPFINRVKTIDMYPKFRTWDLMSRFYLNKNFAIYLLYTNLLDRTAYGLDATGSPDDILMPIQPGRQFRFGVNYNML
jgi:outer membrane receptor protein involved in Fe transport